MHPENDASSIDLLNFLIVIYLQTLLIPALFTKLALIDADQKRRFYWARCGLITCALRLIIFSLCLPHSLSLLCTFFVPVSSAFHRIRALFDRYNSYPAVSPSSSPSASPN
ncbi:hypothetical protein WR25_15113 [Diploscapter pachys]|uniref:Uncharacterized protein n=1 Tax=Diploscapter pachys TaxID=2018661 RepID=A0A2A2LLZ8_9BILA|nr:hypothetical protein WR25_15113 [Diploscapter pachys]